MGVWWDKTVGFVPGFDLGRRSCGGCLLELAFSLSSACCWLIISFIRTSSNGPSGLHAIIRQGGFERADLGWRRSTRAGRSIFV